ncbi:hypothetical protein ACFRIB_53345 [Streptomyces mirabilis]|uniref:hypothetical protein n=1 Tax=Streptomyces mirabilis TaxID=68239 RepID=UPI0036C81383
MKGFDPGELDDICGARSMLLGRRGELAADELAGPQMAEVCEEVSGPPTRFEELPL